MEFYKIGSRWISGEKGIRAVVPYNQYEVFKDPAPLIKNNKFVVAAGRNLYDVVRYEDPFNFAISEGLKTALEENGITGWTCYPIEIEGIEAKYFGFHVTGVGGEVTKFDDDGSISIFEPIQWNKDKWDGSDVFNIEDTAIKAITPKVADVFRKFKIKNLEIKPL